MYVRMNECMYVCMYVLMHVCMYVCMYVGPYNFFFKKRCISKFYYIHAFVKLVICYALQMIFKIVSLKTFKTHINSENKLTIVLLFFTMPNRKKKCPRIRKKFKK